MEGAVLVVGLVIWLCWDRYCEMKEKTAQYGNSDNDKKSKTE